MLEVGDLIQWQQLTIHPNDIATLFQIIKDGRKLNDIPVTNDTLLVQHTGMIERIEEGTVVVIDFVGRCNVSFLMEDAYEKLTILNRK